MSATRHGHFVDIMNLQSCAVCFECPLFFCEDDLEIHHQNYHTDHVLRSFSKRKQTFLTEEKRKILHPRKEECIKNELSYIASNISDMKDELKKRYNHLIKIHEQTKWLLDAIFRTHTQCGGNDLLVGERRQRCLKKVVSRADAFSEIFSNRRDEPNENIDKNIQVCSRQHMNVIERGGKDESAIRQNLNENKKFDKQEIGDKWIEIHSNMDSTEQEIVQHWMHSKNTEAGKEMKNLSEKVDVMQTQLTQCQETVFLNTRKYDKLKSHSARRNKKIASMEKSIHRINISKGTRREPDAPQSTIDTKSKLKTENQDGISAFSEMFVDKFDKESGRGKAIQSEFRVFTIDENERVDITGGILHESKDVFPMLNYREKLLLDRNVTISDAESTEHSRASLNDTSPLRNYVSREKNDQAEVQCETRIKQCQHDKDKDIKIVEEVTKAFSNTKFFLGSSEIEIVDFKKEKIEIELAVKNEVIIEKDSVTQSSDKQIKEFLAESGRTELAIEDLYTDKEVLSNVADEVLESEKTGNKELDKSKEMCESLKDRLIEREKELLEMRKTVEKGLVVSLKHKLKEANNKLRAKSKSGNVKKEKLGVLELLMEQREKDLSESRNELELERSHANAISTRLYDLEKEKECMNTKYNDVVLELKTREEEKTADRHSSKSWRAKAKDMTVSNEKKEEELSLLRSEVKKIQYKIADSEKCSLQMGIISKEKEDLSSTLLKMNGEKMARDKLIKGYEEEYNVMRTELEDVKKLCAKNEIIGKSFEESCANARLKLKKKEEMLVNVLAEKESLVAKFKSVAKENDISRRGAENLKEAKIIELQGNLERKNSEILIITSKLDNLSQLGESRQNDVCQMERLHEEERETFALDMNQLEIKSSEMEREIKQLNIILGEKQSMSENLDKMKIALLTGKGLMAGKMKELIESGEKLEISEQNVTSLRKDLSQVTKILGNTKQEVEFLRKQNDELGIVQMKAKKQKGSVLMDTIQEKAKNGGMNDVSITNDSQNFEVDDAFLEKGDFYLDVQQSVFFSSSNSEEISDSSSEDVSLSEGTCGEESVNNIRRKKEEKEKQQVANSIVSKRRQDQNSNRESYCEHENNHDNPECSELVNDCLIAVKEKRNQYSGSLHGVIKSENDSSISEQNTLTIRPAGRLRPLQLKHVVTKLPPLTNMEAGHPADFSWNYKKARNPKIDGGNYNASSSVWDKCSSISEAKITVENRIDRELQLQPIYQHLDEISKKDDGSVLESILKTEISVNIEDEITVERQYIPPATERDNKGSYYIEVDQVKCYSSELDCDVSVADELSDAINNDENIASRLQGLGEIELNRVTMNNV